MQRGSAVLTHVFHVVLSNNFWLKSKVLMVKLTSCTSVVVVVVFVVTVVWVASHMFSPSSRNVATSVSRSHKSIGVKFVLLWGQLN